MRVINASYVVENCPDGEAALARLERYGRTAYKSEDRIVEARYDTCPVCHGDSFEPDVYCGRCGGTGKVMIQAPSSHAFVRMIMKAERRAKLERLLRDGVIRELEDFGTKNSFVEGADEWGPKLIENIIAYMDENPSHESVIEHESFTAKFFIDRGVSHEMVRHRLAAFTQESTRYCNYASGRFDGEVTFILPCFWDRSASEDPKVGQLYRRWAHMMEDIEDCYRWMIENGASPQQARSVLPNSLKTEVVMSANMREWRHVFKLRTSKAAHPQMREVMIPLLAEMKKRIPVLFDDIVVRE